jgi:hypothetical protein
LAVGGLRGDRRVDGVVADERSCGEQRKRGNGKSAMRRLGLPLAIWLLAASVATGVSLALLQTSVLAENGSDNSNWGKACCEKATFGTGNLVVGGLHCDGRVNGLVADQCSCRERLERGRDKSTMMRLGLPLATWLLAACLATGVSLALLQANVLAENSSNADTGGGNPP